MRINFKYFTLGATLGLIVLLNQQGYLALPEKKPFSRLRENGSWKASYEQLCVEDTASRSGCLCAVAYVEQSSPAAELDGERIYMETKDMLKGVCLE